MPWCRLLATITYRRLQKVGTWIECRMTYAGIPSFCGVGLGDGYVPTFWLLLYHLISLPPADRITLTKPQFLTITGGEFARGSLRYLVNNLKPSPERALYSPSIDSPFLSSPPEAALNQHQPCRLCVFVCLPCHAAAGRGS